jgi:hypothetical protein
MPSHAALYFLESEAAHVLRLQQNPLLSQCPAILWLCDQVLRRHNPFYHIFFRAREFLQNHPSETFIRLNPQLRLITNHTGGRQYDLPSVTTELAAFVPDIPRERADPGYRDIQLYLRQAPSRSLQQRGIQASVGAHAFTDMLNELPLHAIQGSAVRELNEEIQGYATQPYYAEPDVSTAAVEVAAADEEPPEMPRYLSYIHQEHALYLPLSYPLFFPKGGQGYSRHQTLVNTTQSGEARVYVNITPLMYYRWLLFIRNNCLNILHRGAMLFQQIVVDMWLTNDMKNLEFYRFSQKKLRAETYSTARLAFNGGLTPEEIGRRVILPSTVKGSVRFMQQQYQDSMAIVRHYGKPCLFVTFTCNPDWDEITTELLKDGLNCPMQTWRDRPDLVSRVFRMKLRELHKMVTGENGIFGPCVADVWVIEYQKRGMPHAHMLLWLKSGHQFFTPELVDEVISAEIPPANDPKGGQRLHDVVTRQLIHKPCGNFNLNAPCMVDGKCSKRFPRAFCNATVMTSDSYPTYRRRDLESSRITMPHPTRKGDTVMVGNEWVVPHNPFLAWTFQAHINVEVCSSIKAIKYIHKYIYKGPDRATAEFEVDEIRQYINGR